VEKPSRRNDFKVDTMRHGETLRTEQHIRRLMELPRTFHPLPLFILTAHAAHADRPQRRGAIHDQHALMAYELRKY
jgi:hypothetical protein